MIYLEYSVNINSSSSGNTTLVAASSGNRIRILGLYLHAAGTAVAVSLQDGAGGSNLIGPINLGANGGFVLPLSPSELRGWHETSVGTLLNMNLSGAVQVSGVLRYCLVPQGAQ